MMTKNMSKFWVVFCVSSAATLFFSTAVKLSVPDYLASEETKACRAPAYAKILNRNLMADVSPRIVALTIWNSSQQPLLSTFSYRIRQFVAVQWFSLIRTKHTAIRFCEAASITLNERTIRGLPNIEAALLDLNLATMKNSTDLAICVGSDHIHLDLLQQSVQQASTKLIGHCESFYHR